MVPWRNLTGGLGNAMFQQAYIYGQMRKGNIPDIYVQSPWYFQDYQDEIRTLYGVGVTRIDQVAIHVRRGDYVGNPFYVDLMKTDYYEKAMALFPNADFLVFSDDIEWCKEQPIFQAKNIEFSEGNDEITDLNLMASCKGVITANSSYSWWGGFLSKGPVVAPKKWYADGNNSRTECPKEWIRV